MDASKAAGLPNQVSGADMNHSHDAVRQILELDDRLARGLVPPWEQDEVRQRIAELACEVRA